MSEDELDETLRALAHRERRMFLSQCWRDRRAAGDLASLSRLSLATVSEHLKVLRKTGLLQLEKDGRFWFYQTNRERLDAVSHALAMVGAD